MLRVLIEGPTNVFCNDEVVCKNTTKLQAVLKKEASQYCLSLGSKVLLLMPFVRSRNEHARIVEALNQDDGSTEEGELVG
jgi:hypothetical protein